MAKNPSWEEKAQAHVKDLFLQKLSPHFVFHNYSYTEKMVETCCEFAEQADLSKKEVQNLLVAAWFSQTGLTQSSGPAWEESREILSQFLAAEEMERGRQEHILDILEGAFEKAAPESVSQKILYDAYWSFLGDKKLDRYSRLLRMEKEKTEGISFSAHSWHQYILDLLLDTRFFTPWALDSLSVQKNKNVDVVNQEVKEVEKEEIRRKTGKDFGRGIDTIYRVTLQNHMNFSSIADGKANMIISINTLVLSIIITVASAGLSMEETFFQDQPLLIIPIIILMLSSLIAILYAVLSAIPKVSQNFFTQEDIASHKVSMLYFGNFLQLKKQEFVQYLKDLKEDQEILYDDLSKDLYSLGQVLQKKYRLLTISYRVFIGGLIASVAALLLILTLG